MTKSRTLILIDEPIEHDHRVLSVLRKYPESVVVDCTNTPFNKAKTFYGTLTLLKAVFLGLYYWFFLFIKYGLIPKGVFKGVSRSMAANRKSIAIAKYLMENQDFVDIKLVYANDLMCGVVGKELSKHFGIDLIYDAHELEFHRNRKNSFIRVVFDILLEKSVIKYASKIIVVNKPIKTEYMALYHIEQSKISIISNNHFTPYIGYTNKTFSPQIKDIAIVYVGSATNGRKLESLTNDSNHFDLKIHGFFLGKIPRLVANESWIMGTDDYLDELLELVKQKRLAMWCCTEDICLSYRLSLPNKFFQAVSIGIPVIAYKGSYLAEVVKEHNLGFIYNDFNFLEIVESLQDTEKYFLLIKSIESFQNKLFVEGMVL